jgi:EAL domain-containing protein (putative c-di-GMP-specific phosphodiesterase class I)
MTETLAVDDPAQASRFSAAVRALGCRFAVDDFGSGYTTFRNLMAIEADMIKIDGTLIEGIASDQNKQTFIRMMVDLAQTFGVKTVAEMVDDRADAEILRRLGVDYLQGFMFGVPSAAPSWQKRAS